MALERFDPQTQLSNVKKVFSWVTEMPKLVEQTPREPATRSIYPIDKRVIQQRWREMTPSKTDDPIVSYLNNNAPEWFMVDLPKAEKILRFVKQENPDLQGEDVVKKAVEYLPSIHQYDMEKNQTKPTQQTQWSRYWAIKDETNIFWIPKIPRFNDLQDTSVKEWATRWEVLWWFAKNLWKSALNLWSDVANFVLDPVDSWDALLKMWAGALVNAYEWVTGDETTGKAKEFWDIAAQAGKYFTDRYGSVEWFSKASYQDPVWVFSDIVSLVGGVWSVAKWATKLAPKSWLLQKVWDVGSNLQRVWMLDPANKVTEWMSYVWGKWVDLVKDGIKWATKFAKEAKPIEYVASKILWTTEDQWKLFKAQEPRLGQLNKSIDYKKLREKSDIANTEIVNAWYKPTDTASRAEAHANTMQQIWDNEIKARIGTEFDIDLNSVADEIDNFIARQEDAGLVKNKAQLKELQAQAEQFRKMWTVDWAKGEFIKEMINAQINNWWDSSIWDVYKNWMKEAARKLWENLDDAFSRIPWEFSDAKKRFWALKATYSDVVKADLKAQKAKWLWLTETFSRIEWFGDILWGIWGMILGKNPIPEVLKGGAKLLVGKVLKKLKDNDFLIQEWFEWLSKTANPQSPVIKAQTNRKALPLRDWMQFESPRAQIGASTPRGYDITETGMENVRQPLTSRSAPLVKSIAQPVDKSLNVLKKLEADPTLEKVPSAYLNRGKWRIIQTKYGTVDEMIPNNQWTIIKVKVWDKTYDTTWLDFFEKKMDLWTNKPLVKAWVDNRKSLDRMQAKWKRQSISIQEWLKELWVTIDDLNAAQLKEFWELVRARKFDDARQKKWDWLKVQVSTKAPKLPVAKKTPLVKATDSTNISPKVKKPLIKAQVGSKVDDALPSDWKMENTLQKAKSLDSSDLTKEVKKFWEFRDVDIMNKNEVFSKFETDVMKEKLSSWVSRATADKISMLDTQLRRYWHRGVKNNDFWSMYKLEDIYDNKEFFDKYPTLKDANIIFVDFHTPKKYWLAVGNDIYINSKLYLKDKDKIRSTIVHEIQHMKQDIRWMKVRDSEVDSRTLWDRYKTDPREIDAKRKQDQYLQYIANRK